MNLTSLKEKIRVAPTIIEQNRKKLDEERGANLKDKREREENKRMQDAIQFLEEVKLEEKIDYAIKHGFSQIFIVQNIWLSDLEYVHPRYELSRKSKYHDVIKLLEELGLEARLEEYKTRDSWGDYETNVSLKAYFVTPESEENCAR